MQPRPQSCRRAGAGSHVGRAVLAMPNGDRRSALTSCIAGSSSVEQLNRVGPPVPHPRTKARRWRAQRQQALPSRSPSLGNSRVPLPPLRDPTDAVQDPCHNLVESRGNCYGHREPTSRVRTNDDEAASLTAWCRIVAREQLLNVRQRLRASDATARRTERVGQIRSLVAVVDEPGTCSAPQIRDDLIRRARIRPPRERAWTAVIRERRECPTLGHGKPQGSRSQRDAGHHRRGGCC